LLFGGDRLFSSFFIFLGSSLIFGNLGFVGIFPSLAFFSAYKSLNNCLQEQL